MPKQKHTPGPWYTNVNKNSIQGLIIAEGTGVNIAVSYDPKDANLISAAPELLEDLRSLRARVLALSQALRKKGHGDFVNDWLSDGILSCDSIAKAEDYE